MVTLQNMNIDLQNENATFFFNDILPGGTGVSPWVNVTVKIEGANEKTGSEVKAEAALKAVSLLQDVVNELIKIK